MIIILGNIKRAYQITLFSTVFTRMAFLNVGENSILVHHILTLVLLIKICISDFHILRRRRRIPVSLLMFVAYAGFSIFFALYHGDVEVINVNNLHTTVKFGLQQFTQYAYLVFAVIFMFLTYCLLETGELSLKELSGIVDISYITVILLGGVQLFVPSESFDAIFRNSLIGTVHQTINGRYRIDSVFGEASMMMLFVTPVFCRSLYGLLLDGLHLKNVFLVILGLAAFWGNLSSSFIVGMGTLLVIVLTDVMVRMVKGRILFSRKKIWMTGIMISVSVAICFIFREEIAWISDVFMQKLRGENVSGMERSYSIKLHWKVFSEHMAFGVGFGTLRGYDLMTSWLAQMGLAGMGLYLYLVMKICFRLIKKKTNRAMENMVLIIVHNVIMMISVPEFGYVFLWVYFAAGWFLAECSDPAADRTIPDDRASLVERQDPK